MKELCWVTQTHTENKSLQASVSIYFLTAVLLVAAWSCCLSALWVLADEARVFLDLEHPTGLWEISEEGFFGNRDKSRSTAASSQADLGLTNFHFTCEETVWVQLYADCQLEVNHRLPATWTDLLRASCILCLCINSEWLSLSHSRFIIYIS